MFSQLNLGIVLNEDEIQARVLAAHDNGKIVGQEFVLESFREFLDSYKSPGLDALLTNLSLTTFVESSESESAEPTPSDGEPVADATDDTPSSVKSNGPNRKPRRSDVSRNTDDGSESDLSNVAINF